jgi:Aminoglycoside-2''-adenylyltransferase
VSATDNSSEQLSALDEVSKTLDGAEIDYWLFGGWAVDFYAGVITRAHDDIDLAVWLIDLPAIRSLLHKSGWRHAPDDDEDGGTGFERGHTRLELTFLVRDANGTVYIPVSDGRIEWSAEAFKSDVKELQGIRSRVIALDHLRLGKSFARDDPHDADKDRADFKVLTGLGDG